MNGSTSQASPEVLGTRLAAPAAATACSRSYVTHPAAPRPSGGAEDPRIRRSWLIFATALFALATISAMRLFGGGTRPVDLAVTGLIVVVGFAAVRHRIAVQRLEEGRWTEAESFARILQGLSRSISPDAIVGAIVDELGAGTGADHVVIVRRRPESPVLEATLVNARTGGSTSSTLFPIGDLEDPPTDPARARRDPVGIPIARAVDPADVPPRLTPARSSRIGSVVAVPTSESAARAAYRSGRRSPTAGPVASLRAPSSPGPPGDADPTRRIADRIAARAREVFGLRFTLS